MPIFDNEINDKDVKLSNLELPDVDLRSPNLTKINPNLGNEPFGFGDTTPTFNGVAWGEMRNAAPQIGFDQPFSTVSGKTLMDNQRYPLYERDVDLENINALTQPWYKQVGNGLVKGGVGFIGGFTESMMTIPDTISAVKSGDISKLYGGNEGIEKDMGNWVKKMEDVFPNYVSKYEREHPFKSVFGSGFANFLGDGLLKNIGTIGGYVAGAAAQDLAVGYVTGGMGDIPLLGAQLGKVANAVGKGSLWLNKLITGTNDVEKFLAGLEKVTVLGAETTSAVRNLGELAASAKINKGFRYALAQYGTARTMGAIDARDTYEQIHNKLIEDYKLKNNGEAPVGQALAEIENYSKDGANTRFGVDFALMLLADNMQFDNLFRSFGSKGSASILSTLEKEAQIGGKIGLKVNPNYATGAAGEKLATWESVGATSAKGKLWEKVAPTLPNIFAQGVLTMGGLYASGKGVEDYYVNKYKNLSDPNNKKNFDTVNEIINSTMYGLSEQFGTAEGQKAMFMGSVLGLAMHAVKGGIDRGRGFSADQRLADSIETVNRHGVTDILQNKYESALNTLGNIKGMEESVKENNVFKYKNFQYNNFFELVHSRLQKGMHEFTIEELSMLKDLPKAEFEKYFNVEFSESNKKTVNEYVDKMIEHANELKKTYDAIAGTFKNPFAYYRKEDTEAKKESNRGFYNFEKWKTELTYQSGKSIDVNDRIESIQQNLYKIHPDLNNNGVAGLVNPITLKQFAKSYEERAKLLNGTINDDMTPQEKQAIKDQVKSLRTFAEKITSAIDNQNLDLNTFHELLNYELNGNDKSKPDVVGFEHASSLYQYGHDLNMLANEKIKAQDAVKALTSKDGFEKFFEASENMNKDTTFSAEDFEPGKGGGLGDGGPTPPPTGGGGEPTEPTGPIAPKFTNKEGNVESFEIGRQYATEKFNEPKITKIDEDRWQVSVPNGATTFHKSEEKAQQKVNEIKQDYADLAKVKVLGFNEDGSIKVEDINGDIQNIPSNSFDGYEKVETRQEQLIKYAAEVGRVQDELEKNSGDIATGSDEEDIKTMFQESNFEDKKKDAPILFLSTKTESEDWNNPAKSSPHIVRSREFLNTAADFPNRGDLQAILVHYGNQEALGLSGLAELSYGEFFPKDVNEVTNISGGFLAQVYVTKDGYYVDKTGNKIGKVGEPIDVNQVVFQTMPTTSLEGKDKQGKIYKLHRNNQTAEAELSQKQYIALREKIFADKSGSPIYSDFNISEGIGIELEDGKERNNVTETLLPADEKVAEKLINTQKGLITISKDGRVQFKGKSVKIPKGRPVFKYGDTLVPLNNGKLTPARVDAIFEIFKKVSDNMKTFSKVAPELEFLQNVVFYKRASNNRTANQVSIDEKTMTLYIGNDSFDISDVANNEKAIKEKLSNLYTNINSVSLEKNFGNKFREFYMKNGELTSNVWDNYQTYLLSSKYPDGSARPELDIPLKTSIAKRTAENPVNFKQRYSTIIPTNLPYKAEAPAAKVVIETADEKQEAATELEKQANGAIMGYVNKAVAEDRAGESKFADDNETLNTYTLPGNLGEVGFFLDKDGNVELADTEKVTAARNAIVAKLQAIANKKAQQAAPTAPVVITPMDIIEERRKKELFETFGEFDINEWDKDSDLVKSYNEINAKYDAELAALEGGAPSVVSSDIKRFEDRLKVLVNKVLGDERQQIDKLYEEKRDEKDENKKKLIQDKIDKLGEPLTKNEINEINLEIASLKSQIKNAKAILEGGKVEEPKQNLGLIATINTAINNVIGSKVLPIDDNPNQPGKWKNGEFIPDNLGSQMAKRLISHLAEYYKNGKVDMEAASKLFKEYAKEVHPDKHQSPEAQLVADSFFKAMVIARDKGQVKLLDNLKSEYDKIMSSLNIDEVDPNKFKGTAPKDDYKRVGVDPDQSQISDAELALFKRWHAKNVPGIPYEVLEHIVTTHDGEKAFGVFQNGVAKFYKMSTKGSEYHEVFHGVWNGFLSKDRQKALIEEFKAQEGSFTERSTGKQINYSDATDKQAEERIADDFGEFRKGKMAAKSFGQKILDFFKSIIEFFKSFGTKTSLKDKLFKDIDTGKFKKDVMPDWIKSGLSKEAYELSNRDVDNFEGTVVHYLDHIGFKKDGREIVARNVNKGEKILIVKRLLQEKFNDKSWTKPTNSDPLPEDTFKSVNELTMFVLLHEKAHEYILREKGESNNDYETRVNNEALRRLNTEFRQDPLYKQIEGITPKQTHEFVQDMTLRARNFLFNENKESIYNPATMTSDELFRKVEALYIAEGKRERMSDKAWGELVQKTKESLRTTLGLKFNEEGIADINAEGTNTKEYDRDAFSIGRNDASSAIKIGLMLPMTSNKATLGALPERQLSSIEGYKILPYVQGFSTIMDRLSNTSDVDLAMQKLAELAKNDPNYVRVFKDAGGNPNDFTFSQEALQSPADWRYFVDFYQTFTKMKPEVVAQYTNGNEVYLGAANLYTAAKNIQRGWLQNMRDLAKKEGALIKFNSSTKTYNADPEVFANTPIENDVDKLNFLNELGVNITPDVFAKLSDKEQEEVAIQASAIHEYLKNTKELVSLTDGTLDVKGRFAAIAEIVAKTTNPLQDGVYTGVDGKTRQSNTQNNALSLLANRFNESGSLTALKENRPELNDVFSTHSLTLQKGGEFFDKEGNKIEGKELRVRMINGDLDEVKDRGKNVTKFALGKRFTTEINQNVNGSFYVLNPADGASEWEMNLGVKVPFKDVQGGIETDIHKIFKGYLLDDIALALDFKNRSKLKNVGNKAKDLRFFKDILSTNNLKAINDMIAEGKDYEAISKYVTDNISKINSDVTKYLNDSAELLKNALMKNDQITLAPTKTNESDESFYRFKGLVNDFAKEAGIDKFMLKEQDVNDLVKFIDVNKTIANIEYHKILFGDPYQFKIKVEGNKTIFDETKRVKSFDSPAQTTFNSDAFNNWHNVEYNKAGEIALEAPSKDKPFGDPGHDVFKDYLSTVTVNDMTVFGRIMGKTTENDAASVLMDTAYRQVKLRDANWGPDAEANFQWNMAYTRRAFDKRKDIDWSYEGNEALKAHDDALLATPEPKFIREIIKPLARGNKYGSDKIDLILDKYSQMPLYYKDVEKDVLGDLYVKMWKEKQDYIVAESGRKLGIVGVHEIYVGGKFNEAPFADDTIVKVPWSIYGIQVENDYDAKGGKVTSSVQVPKAINIDLFANGKPATTDPARAKIIQDEYDRGVRIKNELNRNGYENLLTKLGIDSDFNVVNRKALADTLNHEVLRIQVSENVKDAVKVDADGNFPIPFEASFAYKKIKDIIYSMLDKSINHAKTNGGSYVQAPVTMWENAAEGRRIAIKTDKGYKEISRADYDKLPEDAKDRVVLTDDTLKFYTPEDPYCEIMIPHWFKEKIKSNKRFDTDEKVLNYLNLTKEGQEILRGVAFRTPVQGANSIEAYRVKKFLPQSMGKTIVVPSEITTKAGSDFDVDKITAYLKNIYIDKNNDIKLVRYQGSEEATREFFAKEFDDILQAYKGRKEELIKDIVFSEEDSDVADQIFKDLSKLDDKALQSSLKEKFVNDNYRAALENEYYDHLEKMITLPEMYEQLTTPIGDAGLAKFAEMIDDLENNQDELIKNRMINGTYLTELRHAFVMAKDWVGIVAVNISAHSIAQKGNVYIDPARFENIDSADLKYLGDGKINIPHNTVEIDGVKYATLSGIKTADGTTNISTRLGGTMTAVVDVSKDPYILKIINSNLAPTIVMFLERIGAGETGLMFLKQPIIKDFLTRLDNRGATSIYNQFDIDDAFSRFQTTENALLSADTLNIDKLAENIRKYNREGLSATENAEQHLILKEFLKYAKMADYLSDTNQALTYDTARFSNGEALSKKQYRTERALKNNIFAGVQELLDNTFLGEQARFLDEGVNAIGEVLKLEGNDYTNITNQVLAPYMKNKYLRADDFNTIGNKIKMSFLDYIIQIKGDINDAIEPLIADTQTSIASQLAKAKEDYPNMEILKALEATPAIREGGPRSVKLSVNLRNDSVTEDVFTGYMRELRDNPGTNELYNNLVKVSILQGMYKSPISIGNIIPIEDVSNSITPIINGLRVDNELKAYTQGWFQRNNFKDPSIFTKIEPKFKVGSWSGPSWDPDSVPTVYYSTQYFPSIETYNIASTDRKILKLSEKYNYLGTKSDYVQFARGLEVTRGGKPTGEIIDTATGKPLSKNQIRLMREKGDESFKDLYNYQRVKNADGSPFYIYDNGDKLHVYKLINVYGDGNLVHEYYDTFKPSPFKNGTIQVKEELTDDQVRNALSFKADTNSKAVTTVSTKLIEAQPVTSNKPEFSKLPSASSTPTMTYAGIGSRQTPPEVLKQMTELAKELESKGYTLRSGGAEGADTAFESGTTKKEIFKGFDQAGEREIKIAHEIHPNLTGAMEASKRRANEAGKNGERSAWAVQNLMARNTNQVFGKNLDTPSDFVVFYAKETKGIRPEGGTGQAVEMARLKGIPTINLANPNWRAELNKALEGKSQKTETQQTNIQPKGEQVKEGIYVNQSALDKAEQLELFDYLKPFLEEQASKTNKGASASKMIGLGLRWDYKSNNVGKKEVDIPDVINEGNRNKYGYYDKSINGQPLGQITPRFRELMEKATGIDMTDYDGAIINLYDNDSFISSHNDVDESRSALKYPVIGINLGGTGNFSIESRDGNPKQLNLKAGTGYVFGVDGTNRAVYHRTFPGKQDSFLPAITTKLDGKTYEPGSYRVTITMRRVMPLEPWTPSSPAIKKEAQPIEPQPVVESQPIEKSGRTILEARQTPIDYTPGQRKALQQIGQLIDNNQQGYYLLAGYAGTGKTTIAENIANYARENGRSVNVLAPTNKAAKVLNDKLRAAGVSVKAETIHRAIYGEPHPETGEWIPKISLKNSVILVDESSMITKEVMADLIANSKNNNIIVFMGDSFQLEPVGQDSKLFQGGVSQVANSQSQLTEVKRQSLDSNILKVATLVRTDNKGYVPEQSMSDFKISKSKNEFVKDFREAIKNNENTVAIVATNNERLIMNDAARLEKFGPDRKILNDGETLIAVANSTDMANSEIFKVVQVRDTPEKHVLTFDFKGKEATYNMYLSYVVGENGKEIKVMHFPALDRPSLYHSEILTAIRNSDPALFNGLDNGFDIIATKKGGAKLSPAIVITTYGYAVTAHKSQGSQWDKVFVNQNYNAPTWNPARWYYTAITRSAKDVVVLPSTNNIRIKNADIESKINSIVTEENDITSQIENEKGLNTKDFKC